MLTKAKILVNNKYFQNSSWMMFEQVLKLVSFLFVGIYIARYLGPDDYGLLNYALAILAIFMALSRIGMDSILVRELTLYPTKVHAYKSTAFYIMLFFAIISMSILNAYIYYFEDNQQVQLLTYIISFSLFFQTFNVIEYNFQANTEAKYPSIAKSLSMILGSIVKIYFVFINADLIYFGFAYLFDYFLIFIFFLLFDFLKKKPKFLIGFDTQLIIPLLKSAWPMMLSTLSVIMYMRVDQIMIMNILDSKQLGLYVAATKFYEAWILFPYVLSLSLIPMLSRFKQSNHHLYIKTFTKLYSLVIWLSIIIAIIFTFYSYNILLLIFGESYVGASSTLGLLMWATVLAGLNSFNARYFVLEKIEKKIAFRTFLTLILNIFLNLFLIPTYGIEGAVIATIVSLFITTVVIDLFDKDLTELRKIKSNSILFRFDKE